MGLKYFFICQVLVSEGHRRGATLAFFLIYRVLEGSDNRVLDGKDPRLSADYVY